MSHCGNFLCSDMGVELLPEICLRVAEFLIDSEPAAVASLMLLSKSFHKLLKNYEKSITRALSKNSSDFEHVNVSQPILVSSRMPPGSRLVMRQTYPWFLELRCRRETIEYLVNHEITEMMDLTNSWPFLDVPKSELQLRLLAFKKSAFLLLYKLADCAVGMTKDMRAQQSEFLESLTPNQLASLGVMVEVIGENYFIITKKSIKKFGLQDNSHIASQQASTTPNNPPTLAVTTDGTNDNWIRERMCVFEDLVQRFGPCFAWAYVKDSSQKARRPDIWARAMLQEGLDNMNAFELGYTMSYASLQSVVWRVFCKKKGCSLEDSWNTAKDLVEDEMAGYNMED